VVDGNTIAQPEPPVKADNTFAGWHSDTAYTKPWDFASDTVTANTALYAKWTAVVRFDANGGETAPPDQTVTSGMVMPSPANPARTGWTFAGWHKEAAGTTPWNFAADIVSGDMTLYAKWEIVSVTKINNVPVDGLINETLDLSAVEAVPPNASVKTIVWTVRDPGTTGVNASIVDGPFTPAAAGTLTLTATIRGGRLDASGNIVDYTENFSVKIAAIRKVTDIVNVPTDAVVDIDVDLSGAEVIPPNATNKTIVWSVKTAGAGVAAISGSVFKPTAAGTLTLTATIVNGDEDEADALHDYAKDFEIAVHTQASAPGNVGLVEDTTIKLYAGTGNDAVLLPAGTVITVAKNSTYIVRIDSSYANVVWHLNGRRSTATGNRLYLDTGKTGMVKVTVEATTRGGGVDTGTHTFSIVE
jgi:uncharacterized repeat protein (TIGR02543 family)